MITGTLVNLTKGLAAIALAWALPTGLASAESRNDAGFKPIKEAELPKGFPTYTPVGKIEIKDYPAARLARAKSAGDNAFWKLFLHIKSHDIAMTAPVQMEYRQGKSGRMEPSTMAFFYGDPKLGSTGPDGSVEVVDVPAVKAVVIGMRGSDARSRIASSREQLENWLKEHAPEYQVAGELRLFGYNSPFIPKDKQFFELQLPIREAKN